jgi:hypothetical protein
MVNQIEIGIRRHVKKFLLAVASGCAVLWTAIEPVVAFFDLTPTTYCWWYYFIYLLTSIIIAICITYPKKKVKFNIKNTNTKIEIIFGDIFTQEGHKVIATNDFFDTQIGKPVSETSLSGIFIRRILGGHVDLIDDAVNAQLANQPITHVPEKTEGKTVKYEIGSTVSITHDGIIYFVFALANADNNCNTSSTPSLMLKVLEGLWNKVRIDGNGKDVNIPLIGSGLSRIGLPPTQLLQLILISILKAAKEKDLSSTIRIVLTPGVFDEIDLKTIENNWK